MKEHLLLVSTLGNGILWGMGFAVGLVMGFLVPVIGDAMAVLLASVLVIALQSWIMAKYVNGNTWIKYTSGGLLLGTALAFGLVFAAHRTYFKLPLSHAIAFPAIFIPILFLQAKALSPRYDKGTAIKWIMASAAGLFIGLAILAALSTGISLELGQLAVRTHDYWAMLNWALIGGVLGTCYGMSTGLVISKLPSN